MRAQVFAIGLLAFWAGTAVAEPVQNKGMEQMRGGMASMDMQNCPMKVKGAEVAVVDTPTGVTVTFTAKPDNVAELRNRLQLFVTKQSERPVRPMMPSQVLVGTVKYEEVAGGGRLMLTPKDPAKIDDFRKLVRARVERMKAGDCSMMQEMMQGAMEPRQNKETEAKPEVDHSEHHPPVQK